MRQLLLPRIASPISISVWRIYGYVGLGSDESQLHWNDKGTWISEAAKLKVEENKRDEIRGRSGWQY
jgi:hypothetical protein